MTSINCNFIKQPDKTFKCSFCGTVRKIENDTLFIRLPGAPGYFVQTTIKNGERRFKRLEELASLQKKCFPGNGVEVHGVLTDNEINKHITKKDKEEIKLRTIKLFNKYKYRFNVPPIKETSNKRTRDISFLTSTFQKRKESTIDEFIQNIYDFNLEKMGLSYEIVIFSNKDKYTGHNIKHVFDDEDYGSGYAYNKCYEASTGKIIISSPTYALSNKKVVDFLFDDMPICSLADAGLVGTVQGKAIRWPVIKQSFVEESLQGHMFNPLIYHHQSDTWLGHFVGNMCNIYAPDAYHFRRLPNLTNSNFEADLFGIILVSTLVKMNTFNYLEKNITIDTILDLLFEDTQYVTSLPGAIPYQIINKPFEDKTIDA